MSDIRVNIRSYIEEHGISMSFISKKAQIDISKLSLTLSCKRGLKAEEYVMICQALGKSCDEFVDKCKTGSQEEKKKAV